MSDQSIEVVPEEAETDEEAQQDAESAAVESPGGSDAERAGEQEGAAQAEPVAAAPGVTSPNGKAVAWREDPLDFDQSSIEIGITLHPLKTRPAEERAVTICVHNHHGSPVFRSFRVAELTDQMPLDRLQTAIAQVVKAFRGELSLRKQAKFEQDQQDAKRRQQQKARTQARPAATPTSPEKVGAGASAAVPAATLAATAAPAAASKAAPESAPDPLVQQTLF